MTIAVRPLCLFVALSVVACSPHPDPCAERGLIGDYTAMYEGSTYLVRLRSGGAGEFRVGFDSRPLTWEFVSEHNLVELDLDRSAADRLREMMGVPRPPDVVVTERGIVALHPICGRRGDGNRLVLSAEKDIEFIRN